VDRDDRLCSIPQTSLADVGLIMLLRCSTGTAAAMLAATLTTLGIVQAADAPKYPD
jgi:hypothetical protein